MKTTSLLTLAAIAFSGVAFTNPASATIDAKSLMLGSTAASSVSANDLQNYELARRGRGADDAPGDTRRGRGADDPAGDDRGRRGRGADDVASGSDASDGMFQLARRGGDDRGGDDNGGRGRGSDDRGGDDRGGARNGGDRNDDNAGGRRQRVPGGSGCDSAHDRAEHAECRG